MRFMSRRLWSGGRGEGGCRCKHYTSIIQGLGGGSFLREKEEPHLTTTHFQVEPSLRSIDFREPNQLFHCKPPTHPVTTSTASTAQPFALDGSAPFIQDAALIVVFLYLLAARIESEREAVARGHRAVDAGICRVPLELQLW
jgi:hypothetical protein